MKVLMISLDPNIVDPESLPGKRMVDYATLTDKLTIVLLSKGGKKQIRKNLTIYPTYRNKILSFLKAFWLSYCTLRKEKYDLITIQDPFIVPLIGFPLSWFFHIPLQLQVHSTFLSPFWQESLKNTIYQTLAKIFIPRAACVRVVSDRIKVSLLDMKVPESKIFVLPIFTEVQSIANYKPRFDLHAKYPQFDFIILMASRLVKQKNISLAVQIVRDLVSKHPNIGLVIVGSGPYEKALKTEANELKENIVFEPWSNDLPSYYKGADVFLLTSNYEGWAMTIIEAMAAGTAVIMSDVGCAGEVVQNGINGVVVTPIGDKDTFVKEIDALYTDPEKRKRLAQTGRESVLLRKPTTQAEYLEEYRKSFEQCLSKREE